MIGNALMWHLRKANHITKTGPSTSVHCGRPLPGRRLAMHDNRRNPIVRALCMASRGVVAPASSSTSTKCSRKSVVHARTTIEYDENTLLRQRWQRTPQALNLHLVTLILGLS